MYLCTNIHIVGDKNFFGLCVMTRVNYLIGSSANTTLANIEYEKNLV